MKTKFENTKLDYRKDQLKVLLEKLIEVNYHTTAKFVFDRIAHTGVESDLNQELKTKPTFEEFLKSG